MCKTTFAAATSMRIKVKCQSLFDRLTDRYLPRTATRMNLKFGWVISLMISGAEQWILKCFQHLLVSTRGVCKNRSWRFIRLTSTNVSAKSVNLLTFSNQQIKMFFNGVGVDLPLTYATAIKTEHFTKLIRLALCWQKVTYQLKLNYL